MGARVCQGGHWRGFPPSAVGTRVVARRSLAPDGGPPYGDVLGVLERTGRDSFDVRTRSGLVTVGLDSVVAARLVGR